MVTKDSDRIARAAYLRLCCPSVDLICGRLRWPVDVIAQGYGPQELASCRGSKSLRRQIPPRCRHRPEPRLERLGNRSRVGNGKRGIERLLKVGRACYVAGACTAETCNCPDIVVNIVCVVYCPAAKLAPRFVVSAMLSMNSPGLVDPEVLNVEMFVRRSGVLPVPVKFRLATAEPSYCPWPLADTRSVSPACAGRGRIGIARVRSRVRITGQDTLGKNKVAVGHDSRSKGLQELLPHLTSPTCSSSRKKNCRLGVQ